MVEHGKAPSDEWDPHESACDSQDKRHYHAPVPGVTGHTRIHDINTIKLDKQH